METPYSQSFGPLQHPLPSMIAIEALTGSMLLLFLRALLIPSNARRTLLAGVVFTSGTVVVAFTQRHALA